MTKLCVHRINFFEPEAKAIHSLAFDQHSNYLAVLRSNNSIEIWNLQCNPHLEKVILAEPENSIECLTWHYGRLFSAGLYGKIVEYNVLEFTPKLSTMIPVGSGVWCMSINESNLAIGTENGYVSIYEISSGLEFKKTLSKQEGRILCIAWHKSGLTLVTGSADTIRIFNVKSGAITDRILVGRIEKKVETLIWCLAVTENMTIISGDSCGRTAFWDGKTATLISSSTTHKADVLSLCLSEDENTVYSAGVDPIIITHVRSQSLSNRRQNWMKSVQRNLHTHDVRALELVGDYLVSGGIDTNLIFSKFPPKTVIPFSPFPQASYCCVSKNSYILLKYPQHLELWKLGKTASAPGVDGERLPLSSDPIHLTKIKCKSDEVIVCFALSNDARWISYSTLHEIKLFHITLEEDSVVGSPIIQRVKTLPSQKVNPVTHLAFMSIKEETFLISLTNKRELHSLLCNLNCPEYVATFYPDNFKLTGYINLMTISSDNSYIALGTQDGNVGVFNYITGQVQCLLPGYKCQPTAMEFDKSCKNLIVAYSDRQVVEFDITAKTYSVWSKKQDFTEFQKYNVYPIRGITCLSSNENIILIYDEETIYKFDKSIEGVSATKRKKLSETENDVHFNEVQHLGYKIISKYKYLLDFKRINEDEMVVIELKPTQIQNSLPPALQRKKYGT